MDWSEKLAKTRAWLPMHLDDDKETGVNCNPSTPLQAAAGVTISTLVKSHALASLYGRQLSLLLQLHSSFSFSPWLAEHIMAGSSHVFHSWSASSCCPQYCRTALVSAFSGVLVTPDLTWRRVLAPLLSLRRDVTSHYNPLSISATTRQSMHKGFWHRCKLAMLSG